MDCRRRSVVDDDRSRKKWAADEDRRRIRLAVDDDRHRRRWAADDIRRRRKWEVDDYPPLHLPLQRRDPLPHYLHEDSRQRRRAVDLDRRRKALWVAQVEASLDRIDALCVDFMHSVERIMSRSTTIPTPSLCSANLHSASASSLNPTQHLSSEPVNIPGLQHATSQTHLPLLQQTISQSNSPACPEFHVAAEEGFAGSPRPPAHKNQLESQLPPPLAYQQPIVHASLERYQICVPPASPALIPPLDSLVSSSWPLTSASRDCKRFRNQPLVVAGYPPLELPLRWRDPPMLQWRDPPPNRTVRNHHTVVFRDLPPLHTTGSSPAPLFAPVSDALCDPTTDLALTCNLHLHSFHLIPPSDTYFATQQEDEKIITSPTQSNSNSASQCDIAHQIRSSFASNQQSSGTGKKTAILPIPPPTHYKYSSSPATPCSRHSPRCAMGILTNEKLEQFVADVDEEVVQKLDKFPVEVSSFLLLLECTKQEHQRELYKARETGSFPRNDLRGKDKEFVLQWLRKPSNEHPGTDLYRNISLLSIVGHGDMGKKTPLQYVYEDETTEEFDLKMSMKDVRRTFDGMPDRSLDSRYLMINGYLSKDEGDDGLLHTKCGTPNYVAPEVLNGRGYDGDSTDLLSCGVVMFLLLAGYLPFDNDNIMNLYKKIRTRDFTFPSWISYGAKRLISRILDPNPMTRITIPGILKDELFGKGYKPPIFYEKHETNLDDIDAAFNDSQVSHVVKKEEQPTALNAFELIALPKVLNLENLFDIEQELKRETRFASKCSAKELTSKIEAAYRLITEGMLVGVRPNALLSMSYCNVETRKIFAMCLRNVEPSIKFMTTEADGDKWTYLLSAFQIFDPGGLIMMPIS